MQNMIYMDAWVNSAFTMRKTHNEIHGHTSDLYGCMGLAFTMTQTHNEIHGYTLFFSIINITMT